MNNMESFKPLVIKIPVQYIPSENQRLTGGRNKTLSPIAKQFKDEVMNSLIPLTEGDEGGEAFYKTYPYLNGEYPLKVTYHFVVTSSFWRRDWDNFIKMFQDTLFEWLELNDSYIVHGDVTKFFAPSAPYEMIVAIIEPSDIDVEAYEKKFRPSNTEVAQTS